MTESGGAAEGGGSGKKEIWVMSKDRGLQVFREGDPDFKLMEKAAVLAMRNTVEKGRGKQGDNG